MEIGHGLSTNWIKKTEREREGNREKQREMRNSSSTTSITKKNGPGSQKKDPVPVHHGLQIPMIEFELLGYTGLRLIRKRSVKKMVVADEASNFSSYNPFVRRGQTRYRLCIPFISGRGSLGSLDS